MDQDRSKGWKVLSGNILPNGRTADVSILPVTPELKQRFFDQAIWHDWCRLFKETVYFGA